MFRRLHLKLTAYMGLILIIFMFIIGSSIYLFTKTIFMDGNKELMKKEATRVYAYKSSSFVPFIFRDSMIFNRMLPNIAYKGSQKIDVCFLVYDDDKLLIYKEENDISIAKDVEYLASKAFESGQDSYVIKKIGNYNYRVLTKVFFDETGKTVVQVYQNTINEDVLMSFLKRVLFVSGIGGTFILIFVSYFITGQTIKPIKQTWTRQKEFIADASHELRTPLTVIQTNLDVVLSDDEGSVEENEIWLDNAYSETRVMASLIDQLLILAKADANETDFDVCDFSLSELIENVCQSMEAMAKKKNLSLEFDIEEDVNIKADYDKMRQLVVILVDNALKYTEKGSVKVNLFSEKNKKVLTVEDTGIGIAKKDLERIFDRFYRADKARHRQGGTGLGLSIAKWIADIHKYTLNVESTVNVGSKFTLRM